MCKKEKLIQEIDWFSIIIPLIIVFLLCAVFMIFPGQATLILQMIRAFLGDECGIYYAIALKMQ